MCADRAYQGVVVNCAAYAPSDGVAAKNIPAVPHGSPPPSAPMTSIDGMDPTNFALHFCCLTHPCALCEEARVVKVSLQKDSSVVV